MEAVVWALLGLWSLGESQAGPAVVTSVRASFRCECPNPDGLVGKAEDLRFYFRKVDPKDGGFGDWLGKECDHICHQGSRRRRKRQVVGLGGLVGFNSCACDEECWAGGCALDCRPPAPLVLDAPSPLWAYAPHQRRAPLALLRRHPLLFPTSFWRRR